MTSPTLIVNKVSDVTSSLRTATQQQKVEELTSDRSSPPLQTVSDPRLTKLPYQPNHQVELLHLQAETEALLQKLRTAKQQRLAANRSTGQ
jgi:hypothetical protein